MYNMYISDTYNNNRRYFRVYIYNIHYTLLVFIIEILFFLFIPICPSSYIIDFIRDFFQSFNLNMYFFCVLLFFII